MRASRYSPVPFWFAAGISRGWEVLKGGRRQHSEDQVSAAATEGASAGAAFLASGRSVCGDRMAGHDLEA